MKKVFAILVLFFFTMILIMASNSMLMKHIGNWMYSTTGWLGSDKYRYGDLYGMSYVNKFRNADFYLSKEEIKSIDTTKRNIQLDAIGDSYMYSFIAENPESFARVKTYNFITWGEKHSLKFPSKNDSSKKILLLEVVERNAWFVLRLDHVKNNFSINNTDKPFVDKGEFPIENNLEFLLFEHNIFTLAKELKAAILLYLFGNLPGNVQVSKDGNYLYLKETLLGPHEGNSFFEIPNAKYLELEKNLNEINDYFISQGYDEVWLTIAPNPVRVLGTENQEPNKLFDYLGQSKNLKIKFLNLMPVFSKDPKKYYLKSDSHWNDKGASAFKGLVNDELLKLKP
jgi:hypothetical protein